MTTIIVSFSENKTNLKNYFYINYGQLITLINIHSKVSVSTIIAFHWLFLTNRKIKEISMQSMIGFTANSSQNRLE